jgi:EmrB/QacA subfamily drug resistance transporter
MQATMPVIRLAWARYGCAARRVWYARAVSAQCTNDSGWVCRYCSNGISPGGRCGPQTAAQQRFMNDERSLSAAESGGAVMTARDAACDFAAPAKAAAVRREAEPLTHREKRLVVISMMLPVFLGSVDQSILASALPTIGRDLGEVHNLPWLITAFLIASTAMTPLYGKVADIHGRRAAMLIGLMIYMAGSLISAASPNMLMLICGRIVQGCGAGGLTVTANMILGDIAAPKERGKYYAYFSIAFTTAGGTGPALGGWISDHLHWQVIFLWSFPLCIVAVVLALTVLRRLPRRERPHRLDFVGAILVMAASSSFMLALNLGGARYPWFSSPIVALLGCGLLLGGGFVVRLLTAAEPLIPIAILSDPASRLSIAAHSFGWGSIVSLNVFLPMYLQSALGWSATSSGLSLMVLMLTLNASAGVSSQLLGRVRHYKILPLCCLVIGVGAVVALALSAGTMTSVKLEIILFLIGIGFGPTAPLTQVALQNTVPIHDLGAGLATMNFVRTLIATILIAIFGAIVLADAPVGAAPDTLSRHFLGGASAASFAAVFLAIAGTLAVAFLSVILLEEKPLQEAPSGSRR